MTVPTERDLEAAVAVVDTFGELTAELGDALIERIADAIAYARAEGPCAKSDAQLAAELKRQAVQLQLIDTVIQPALEKGAAFGAELRLALRISAIRQHKL